MKILAFGALLATLPAVWGATLSHDYNLTVSLNDLIGSATLNSDGGSITGAGYTFGTDQGLNLSNALTDVGDYSILMDFSFDDLDGYRKILDFKDQASDNGLYNLSTDLNFYNFSFGPNGAFSPGTLARVVLTRDGATGDVSGYVNGVLDVSFTDSSNNATFSGTNGIMRFFEDDTATGGREASSGLATHISIYDGALTEAQVEALGGPSTTPEPGSLVLLGIGLAGLALAGWRGQRNRLRTMNRTLAGLSAMRRM